MLKRNQYAGLLCMDLLQPLGIVVQGSLSDGLQVRLNGEISVEDMRVGKFLVVHGQHTRFFCILTDVTLGIASPRILMNPPDPENTFLTEILAGTGTFGTINLTPMLMFVPSNPFDLIAQRVTSQNSDRVQKTKRNKSSTYETVEKRFLVISRRCLMRLKGTFGLYLVGKMTHINETSRSGNPLICPYQFVSILIAL